MITHFKTYIRISKTAFKICGALKGINVKTYLFQDDFTMQTV